MYAMNPGHWAMLLTMHSDLEALPAALLASPIEGVCPRYQWREFSFERMERDLDLCADQGLRLLPMIEDKSFRADSIPVPDSLFDYCEPNRAPNGGYTAIRWADPVVEEYGQLLHAIYTEFGNHLAFEGVQLQESALSLGDAALDKHGYTPQRYSEAIITHARIVADVELRKPKRLFWNQNFFARDHKGAEIDRVFLATSNLAMGGPDCWPTNPPLNERAYPRYADARFFNVPKFIGYSKDSYSQVGYTLAGVHDFAIDKLNVRHHLWTYFPGRWDEVLAVIRGEV